MSADQLGEFGGPMLGVLANTLAAQDLRGMRMVARDMRAMLAGLSPEDRSRVESEIAGVAGSSPAIAEMDDAAEAKAILARGRIRNDREYYLLRDQLDRVESENASPTAARELSTLLNAYRVTE